MGRTRTSRKDLPQRVYEKHGALYFVDRSNKWHRLGKDYHQAMIKYAELNSTNLPVSTMGQVMDRYQAEVITDKSRTSQKENLRQIKLLRAVFGHMRPEEITPQDIYAYMDRRPKVAANREKSLLSHIYSMAIRWGVAIANPCKLVKANREKPRDRYVTDAEFWAVYDIALPVVKVAMLLALMTGLRQGQILDLRRQDCIDEGIRVDASKGGKKLIIGWTPELREAVRAATSLREGVKSIHLICNQRGQKYSTGGFKSLWQRTMAKAVSEGLTERFTFHDIRAKSASDHETGDHLGHRSQETKERVYRRKPVQVEPFRPKKILDKP